MAAESDIMSSGSDVGAGGDETGKGEPRSRRAAVTGVEQQLKGQGSAVWLQLPYCDNSRYRKIFPFLKWYTMTEHQVVVVFQMVATLEIYTLPISSQYSTSVALSGKVALVFYGIEDPTFLMGEKRIILFFKWEFLEQVHQGDHKSGFNGGMVAGCRPLEFAEMADRPSNIKCLQDIVHRFTSIAKLSETLGLGSTPKAVISNLLCSLANQIEIKRLKTFSDGNGRGLK
ncbi:hypothetical protein B0H13DRAFT_1907050 [Mycena leptocephala]|nr:hypothetical protein B0H13DRAFT_1907050 [Mycena leptocephala]